MPGLLVTGQFHDVYASAKLKTLIKSVASSAIVVEVRPPQGTGTLRFTHIHELRHYRLAAADNGLELRGIMAISFAARVNVPESVLVQELQGEIVFLNLESECYLGLDEVGASMWKAMATSPSIQAAYDRLLVEFVVEPDRLRGDLGTLVEELVKYGLVTLGE